MDIIERIYELDIDKKSEQPLYIQIYEKIKDLIELGILSSNAKLPPVRKLASRLNVNVVTVVNAYRLLEDDGYVYSRVGSGTYVSPMKAKSVQENILHDEDRIIREDFKLMDRGQVYIRSDTINFAGNSLSPEYFPVDIFKNLIIEILERDRGFAFGYQESQGFLPLRESIVNFLGEYGINTTPDNVQVISGAQQGLDIVSKALLNFGDKIIVESPTYAGALAVFNTRGAKVIEVPMESDGINTELLEYNLKNNRIKFIYVMPDFQNPTGISYSLEKRKELLRLAKKYNTLIIEDDYVGDLYYGESKEMPLKALDNGETVIYIKSFSKLFMPGLRLAFLVFPIKFYDEILSAKHISDISTSGLIQRVFDLYIRRNLWRSHIENVRRIYKDKFKKMIDNLQKYMPEEVKYNLPKGGFNFWFSLPDGINSSFLYGEALRRGVLIIPGMVFFNNSALGERYIRLSFAEVKDQDIEKGIEILGNIIRQRMDKKVQKSLSPLL